MHDISQCNGRGSFFAYLRNDKAQNTDKPKA